MQDPTPAYATKAHGALGFYSFLNRLGWPRSLTGRLLLICGLATSVPMLLSLGMVVVLGGDAGPDWFSVFFAALAGDLVGIGLMLVGLRLALEPLRLSVHSLEAYQHGGRVPQLPAQYNDELGRLMRSIWRTLSSAESVRADLLHRAETDPLTGVANRRSFTRVGLERLAEAKRANSTLSVIVLDIDRFKAINDTYGHAAGDAVLRLVAVLLARSLRSTDTLARIGGEEFAILLPETGVDDAFALSEQLRRQLATLQMPALDGACVTASFGVAASRSEDADVEIIMHRADMALYEAKGAGRNRVECYEANSGTGHARMQERVHPAVSKAAGGARGGDVAWLPE